MNHQALSSFIWSVADLLRGDYKQSEYGRVILPFTVLRRVWLPRAVRIVLPNLASETVLTLKSTPLAATITVLDLFGVIYRVRQDTYLTYEPLLLLAGLYMILTFIITRIFNVFEKQIPERR